MTPLHHVVWAAALCALLLAACNPAEAPIGAPASTSTVNVSDVDITTHVKSALNSDPSLAGLDIAVVTTKGDIRLTGVVATQTQIDTAVSAARAAEGAHTIHNELMLRK
jgi:osmotically-inducible protein OsmY